MPNAHATIEFRVKQLAYLPADTIAIRIRSDTNRPCTKAQVQRILDAMPKHKPSKLNMGSSESVGRSPFDVNAVNGSRKLLDTIARWALREGRGDPGYWSTIIEKSEAL